MKDKIFFLFPSHAHIYNVIGICKQLKPDQYSICLDISEANKNCYKSQEELLIKILNKYQLKYIIADKNTFSNNSVYFTYKYWFFSVPYGGKVQKSIWKHIKKINPDIIRFTIQAGFYLSHGIPLAYNNHIDIMFRAGDGWFNKISGLKYKVVTGGQPKLNLVYDTPRSSKYFVIFTQPFLRTKCYNKEWGYFNHILFYEWIINAIREIHGVDGINNTVILQHPTSYCTGSENSYLIPLCKKHKIKMIPLEDTMSYFNQIKIAFTYCSYVSLEITAIEKPLLLINTGTSNTNKHFNFDKYGFKTAFNYADVVNFVKEPTLNKTNISRLMLYNKNEEKISDYLLPSQHL